MEQVLEQPTNEIVLTKGQQEALDKMLDFITDPKEQVFVLRGYSGCGKSTLVQYFLEKLPKTFKALSLVDPDYNAPNILLTATTNKAAENLSQLSGQEASTVHSAFSLRVRTDYQTGKTSISPTSQSDIRDCIVLVDEASFIDGHLLNLLFRHSTNCKFIFIGDPGQLIPVNSSSAVVFDSGFKHYPTAFLDEVVRQKGTNKVHPITELSTVFRNVVNSGDWEQDFPVDGIHIQHLSEADFQKEVDKEFLRPDWHYKDSKILAWTNRRVGQFNSYVNNLVKGIPEFQVNDYALVNSFVTKPRCYSFKTEQMIQIRKIGQACKLYGVNGQLMQLDGVMDVFVPNNYQEALKAAKDFRKQGDFNTALTIEEQWPDLRPAYACTINKSQGSTFDKVFIDLNDVSRCTNGNTIARMLYVAISRARHNVYLMGDLA